jgi:hypothetical protein
VTAIVTGDRELDRRLAHLSDKGAKRAGRAAINAGLTVVAKAIRAAVPPVETPGHRKSSITKAVGSRNKKNRTTGVQEAKAGFGVGKKRGRVAPHAHLLALGTDDRHTGSKRDRRRGATGRISTGAERAFRGRVKPSRVVPRGYAASQSDAMKKIIQKLRQRVNIEARKDA